MLSAVKPRRREGRWPAKLQHSALFQIDQALLYLKAPALVSAALEAQGVSEGHVPTRLVWAALRNIKGLQVHPVLWHKMAKATNCAIAINRSGESFFLLADKDQPGTWQVTMNAFDGRLLLSEVGPLAELAKRFEWIDTLWVMNVATNKPNMSQWPQDFVTAPFWHHRREALLILGCGVVVTMLGVITPLGFQALMDKVLPFRASSSLAVVLVMLTLAIFSSSIVEAVHGYLESVMSARLQQRLGFDVFQRLLHMSVDFFDSRPAGEITKLASQINEVAHFQCQQLLSSAVAGLSLVVVLPLLLIYSTSLTMLVLAVGLTMAMTIIFSLKIYQRRVARAYSLDADFQSGLIELIKGIRTIKSLTLERHFYHQQSVRLENQLFGIFDVERLGLFLRAIVGFQSRIVSVLILGVGANAAFKGDFSIGQLIAFYMLSDRLIQPVMSLVMTVNGWQGYRLAKLKLSELHPSASQNQSIIPRRIVDSDYNLDGDICFENVWFRYPNSDIDVLKGITLTIPKGQMLGIVGESGSGKSTLFSLLQGFYAPTKGVIRIGGIDLRDIPPEVTREHMGLVSQSSFLFNQSVFENVRLGRLNSTSNDVLQALEQAECLSFVEEMPSRYGTLLSEDGLNLSGGQRQRLAIARAFLRDAPFMLFDEATSALDRGTEESIKLAVRKVCEGKTALLIAHRWSTLADCDQIVVMDKGQVVQQGLPSEILPALSKQTTEDQGAIRLC